MDCCALSGEDAMSNAKDGVVLWLTGLSGAGKSTLASALAEKLRAYGRRVELLDGDVVEAQSSGGLGFSREDRDANIARIAFVANSLARSGMAVIVAAISPYREARQKARALIGDFVEIHVAPPLEECIRRDVKGLYRKAMSGETARFIGISDPYERPLSPDVRLDTSVNDVGRCVGVILTKMRELGYFERGRA
jgi:adenylylsulfate kinase